MGPHLVVIAGTTEAERIISAVERDWPANAQFRPRWLVTEGVQSVLPRITSPDGAFAARVVATGPRFDFDSVTARRWLSALTATYPAIVKNDPRSGNALAFYDLVYAATFAIARVGARPLTGTNIAIALRDLNRRGAPEVQVGPAAIIPAFEKLQRAQPIDIRAGSGALDWDDKGNVLQDIDILCLPASGAAQSSGLYFDVRQGRLVGRISTCRSQ